MDKKVKWILALAVIAALIAAMIPWRLSTHAFRRELAAQVQSATGFTTHTSGHAAFSLLPRPRIKFRNVTIRAPNAAVLIKAGVLKGDLRILPLLTGHLNLSSLTLFSPDITVDLDKPMPVSDTLSEATRHRSGATADSAGLGIVSIVSGTAHFVSTARHHQTTLRNIDASLDWRNLAAPATLNGTASWRGADANLALWINRPAALLRGDSSSSIDLKIDSSIGSLKLDGKLASRPNLQYEGRIAAYAPLLRVAMRPFDLDVPLPGPLRDARLTAQSQIEKNSFALSDLHFELNGNAFEGTLAMQDSQGHPAWSGTLATDFFTLSPFLTNFGPTLTPNGGWNRDPIDASGLDLGDLDLRLSAGRAHFGEVHIENAGFSILLTGGKLEVALADSKAYGGTLKGRLNISHGPTGLDLNVAANFTDVDSAGFLSDMLHNTNLSGDANGQLTLDGHGKSLAEIMHSLAGQGQFTLADGEVSGIDLEQALRRMEKRPLSLATDMRTGTTGFNSASGTFDVSNGNAQMDNCVATGPGVELAMTGSTEIGDRSLDLHVLARQSGVTATNPDAPQLNLDLVGSWDDPVMVLDDTASLIRRSAVAAPLLRALTPAASTAPAR